MSRPMVTIREETSDEEGSDDTEPDCKFFLEMWLDGEFWLRIRGEGKREWEKKREREREIKRRKRNMLTFYLFCLLLLDGYR